MTIHDSQPRACSPLRRARRRGAVAIVAHAAAVDPIALTRCLLSTPSLVGGLIEGITMSRVPHPVATGRGGRTRTRRKKWLPRRGRCRRRRLPRRRGGSCHFARSLLKCGCRFYPADVINSIVK